MITTIKEKIEENQINLHALAIKSNKLITNAKLKNLNIEISLITNDDDNISVSIRIKDLHENHNEGVVFFYSNFDLQEQSNLMEKYTNEIVTDDYKNIIQLA